MAVDQTNQLKESNGDNISPVLSKGNVTGTNLNMSAFPDTCFFPDIVAEGGNTGVAFSNSSFIGVGIMQSTMIIYDSNYASKASGGSEDIVLQPGCYYAIARARFLDPSPFGNRGCFFGIRLAGEAAGDDIEKGNWQFTNARISIEAKRVFKITSETGVRFQAYCESGGGINKAHIWIYKLPDW